jgi:hypothetical protein
MVRIEGLGFTGQESWYLQMGTRRNENLKVEVDYQDELSG